MKATASQRERRGGRWPSVGVVLAAALAFAGPAQGQTDGPRIVEMLPADGSRNVALDSPVRVRFDRTVDPATLSGDFQPSTTDFTLEWNADNTLAELRLAGPLAPETTYLLAVDNVFDTQGRALANPSRSCFSTGPSLDCPSFECPAHDATDGSVPAWQNRGYEPPFAADSPWNTPIPPGMPLHAESALMIDRLTRTAGQYGGFWLGVSRNVVPVYFADATTPRQDVALSAPNAGLPPILTGVPIPPHARPDCGFDRFLCILDPGSGVFYELHRATLGEDGSWKAATGNFIDALAASGIYPGDGLRSAQGVRASGASLLAGLIWPHELAAGRIEHALALGYQFIRTGGPLPPFTASDGQIESAEAIPMGARLQLDPALDVESLGLTPWELTIARALQEYGAYVVDSAGGISLPAVHVLSFQGNPYAGLLPDSALAEEGVLLSLPAESFRVLSPQVP
jgi:hypothetical protein